MDLSPAQFRAQISAIVSDPDFIDRAVADYEKSWRKSQTPVLNRESEPKRQVPPSKPPEVRYAEDMEKASAELLRAVNRAREGLPTWSKPGLLWRVFSGMDAGSSSRGYRYEPAQTFLPPSRDPCPRCGTRQDIGCKHRRRA